MTDPLPKDFCVLPFIGLHISTSGDISPCCEFGGAWGNVNDTTFAKARNSALAASDRAAFSGGQGRAVKPCWKCFDIEDQGGISLRQTQNKALQKHLKHNAPDFDRTQKFVLAKGAAHLDIRFSNLCNLKCRSCWYGSSSSWFKDAKALGQKTGDKAEIRSIASIDHLMTQLEPQLADIKSLYFAGGEPLMIIENYQLLEIMIARGRTDIELSYTTNGSYLGLGKRSMLDLWRHFKSLEVQLSIDATRLEAASLIRSGFSTDTFVTNVQTIRDTCPHAGINFGITVSALNVMELCKTLEDLKQLCGAMPDDLGIHALQQPAHMQPCVLPWAIKRRASAQIRRFIRELDPEWGTPAQRSELVERLNGICGALRKRAPLGSYVTLGRTQKAVDKLRGENSLKTLSAIFPDGIYPTLSIFERAALFAKRNLKS